jgi:cytochrome c oxidase assembly protein subunit 15
LHWLALFAAVFTWPLLLVGGAVSVYKLGMAVPDWPTTFGLNMFYYNLFEAPRGVFAEHSHRLYGSLVGMACLGLAGAASVLVLGARGLFLVLGAMLAALLAGVNPPGSVFGMSRFVAGLAALGILSGCVALWALQTRRDFRLTLAWLCLAAVVVQGALGGSRVTLNSPTLAFVHGLFGQVVFVLLVSMWVVTAKEWNTHFERPIDPVNLRRRSTVTLLMVFLQIVAGAYVRHFGSVVAVALHALLATAVLAHVLLLYVLLPRDYDRVSGLRLRSLSLWMLVWVFTQLGLGVAAVLVLWPFDGVARPVDGVQALVRIGHQGLGALLFANAAVLALRSWHSLSQPQDEAVAALGNARRAPEVVV